VTEFGLVYGKNEEPKSESYRVVKKLGIFSSFGTPPSGVGFAARR